MADKLDSTAIKVGQKVVLVPYGNFARFRTTSTRTVTKVGRKYFYIGDYAFDRETGKFVDKSECNGGFTLYPTLEAYEEELALREMRRTVADCFALRKRDDIPTEAIEEIYAILKRYGVIEV